MGDEDQEVGRRNDRAGLAKGGKRGLRVGLELGTLPRGAWDGTFVFRTARRRLSTPATMRLVFCDSDSSPMVGLGASCR